MDVGADFVVRELGVRGRHVVRLNTERAPNWRLSLEPGVRWVITSGSRSIVSSACCGVWWRRPEMPVPELGVSSSEADAVWDQWRAFLGGLATVPGPRWVSHPAAIHSAENKAAQLATAGDVGLRVPATIWTNHLDEADAFMRAAEGVAAIKTVATAYWEIEGRRHFVFARAASVDDLPDARALAAAPICIQELISPKVDIRITVVGNRFFAARRCASEERTLDWRLGEQAPWAPCAVPDDLGERCVALVQAMGLRFAGIDVVVAGDGECTFIELNPNGEWGWLQTSGLPIASAIADELCAG